MEDIDYDLLSVEELNKEVEKGNLYALFNLALRYQSGDGVEQDINKALDSFNRVYNDTQDYDLKCYVGAIIGEIYLYDEQNRNIDLAVKHLEESAEYGLPNARLYLGLYLTGIDYGFDRTEEQLKRGARLLIDLFEESKTESPDVTGGLSHYVAVLYANGKGVEKNLIKAKECAELAIELTDAEASKELLKYINSELTFN